MKKELDLIGDVVTDLLDGIHGKKPIGEVTIAGDQELTNDQRARLPYIMALYNSCFLCNAKPPPYGMFAWTMDGDTIITPVCWDCSNLVGVRDIIFAMVLDLIRRRRMH